MQIHTKSHYEITKKIRSYLPVCLSGTCSVMLIPTVMRSPQKGKRKHLANRKFPRKKTAWNSHQHTPDGAVHRHDGITNITSLHRTLKK